MKTLPLDRIGGHVKQPGVSSREKGEGDKVWARRREGSRDEEKKRDRRKKEGGEEGSRNQTASQGDPEFSRLCLAEKEMPCVLN